MKRFLKKLKLVWKLWTCDETAEFFNYPSLDLKFNDVKDFDVVVFKKRRGN